MGSSAPSCRGASASCSGSCSRLISFFWYYAAVVIAVGALGYMLGAGLVAVVFADSGFLQFVGGIVVGAVFAVGAFVLAFPAVLVIVVSAVSGAIAVVNGALILFGAIKVEDLERWRLRRRCYNYGFVGTIAWPS